MAESSGLGIWCASCQEYYSSKRSRIQHEQTLKHEISTGILKPAGPQCQYCGEEFTRHGSVKRHERQRCRKRLAFEYSPRPFLALHTADRTASAIHAAWPEKNQTQTHQRHLNVLKRPASEVESFDCNLAKHQHRSKEFSTPDVSLSNYEMRHSSTFLGPSVELVNRRLFNAASTEAPPWPIDTIRRAEPEGPKVSDGAVEKRITRRSLPQSHNLDGPLQPGYSYTVTERDEEEYFSFWDSDALSTLDCYHGPSYHWAQPVPEDGVEVDGLLLPSLRPAVFPERGSLDRIGATTKKTAAPCPICKKSVEGDDLSIVQHFKGHFDPEADVHSRACTACDLVFPTGEDLNFHLQYVSFNKTCGFEFLHLDGRCTGHHPAIDSDDDRVQDHQRFEDFLILCWGQVLLRRHLWELQGFLDSKFHTNAVSSQAWSVAHCYRLRSFQSSLVIAMTGLTITESEPSVEYAIMAPPMPQVRSRVRERLHDHALAPDLAAMEKDVQNTMDSLLITASRNGMIACVEALIAAGANTSYVETTGTATALMAATQQGHLDIVKTLLRQGADPDYVDDKLGTALVQAIEKLDWHDTRVRMVEELLDAGANMRIGLAFRATSSLLEHAISRRRYDLALVFLAKMSDQDRPLIVKAARRMYEDRHVHRAALPIGNLLDLADETNNDMIAIWNHLCAYGPSKMFQINAINAQPGKRQMRRLPRY